MGRLPTFPFMPLYSVFCLVAGSVMYFSIGLRCSPIPSAYCELVMAEWQVTAASSDYLFFRGSTHDDIKSLGPVSEIIWWRLLRLAFYLDESPTLLMANSGDTRQTCRGRYSSPANYSIIPIRHRLQSISVRL